MRHTGTDLHAEIGDPVYAVADGEVRYTQAGSEIGGYVVLEHGDLWTSTYTHVVPKITKDKVISRGEIVAIIANIERAHLHFQVQLGKYENLVGPLRGRLPESECSVKDSLYPQPEPAFPDQFVDPKCLGWEK